MKIIKVPIEKCELWDKNPRGITKKDFERLKKQIQKLGVYKPLIACQENGKYIILGGNMRLRALQELGYKEVELSIVEAKTEKEKIEYSLSDNDRVGYYEEEKLAELIYPHLDELELEDFKIDIGEAISLKDVAEDFGPDIDDEKADEVPEIDDTPAITQPGDLYQLGRHRLLCGDATKEEDVKRLLDGAKADLVFTDPPYGINIARNGKIGGDCKLHFKGAAAKVAATNYKPIKGDDKPFNPQHLLNLGKNQIVFGANYFASKLPEHFGWVVWDKKEKEHRDSFADCELAWTSFDRPARIYRHLWAGLLRKGERKDELSARVHPTQKPVGLFANILKDFSKEGDIILDPYLGSGTTLIACEKTGRICYGMEIEPDYCDLIIKRFSEYAGIPEEEIRKTRQAAK